MNLIDVVNEKYLNPNVKNFPDFKVGDTVAVHALIKEGAKERVQIFEGICISKKNPKTINGHFRIRKLAAGGIGVERVFPYHSPSVSKIEVKARGKAKRAKLFYLRERTGKAARVAIDFNR